MKLSKCRVLVMLTLLTLSLSVHAVELLRWERLPLAIPLIVGQERVVFIDRNIRVGVPASLADRLRVQSAGGAIYLRASAPIEPTRLQLQDAENGAVILLDITATTAQADQMSLEPVRIIEATSSTQSQRVADAHTPDAATSQATPIPVVLIRYAAQNLYAPLRTLEPVAGITRVNASRHLPLETLLPTLPLQTQLLAIWRLEDLWVSAVRLRNTSSEWLNLDPRALQGNFMAACFQHPDLGPTGTPDDTTVVYLITKGHSLDQALLPAINPFDAAATMPMPDMPTPHQGGAHAE